MNNKPLVVYGLAGLAIVIGIGLYVLTAGVSADAPLTKSNLSDGNCYYADRTSVTKTGYYVSVPQLRNLRIGSCIFFQITSGTPFSDTLLYVNRFTARKIVRSDGLPMNLDDIRGGGMAHVVFDGQKFQLMNPADSAAQIPRTSSGSTSQIPRTRSPF